MAQCLHANEKGRRCRRTAEEDSNFCRWHSPEAAMEPSLLAPEVRKLVFRGVALVLLAIFLLPLAVQGYRLLKAWLN